VLDIRVGEEARMGRRDDRRRPVAGGWAFVEVTQLIGRTGLRL
jgi:hypothetical protein